MKDLSYDPANGDALYRMSLSRGHSVFVVFVGYNCSQCWLMPTLYRFTEPREEKMKIVCLRCTVARVFTRILTRPPLPIKASGPHESPILPLFSTVALTGPPAFAYSCASKYLQGIITLRALVNHSRESRLSVRRFWPKLVQEVGMQTRGNAACCTIT